MQTKTQKKAYAKPVLKEIGDVTVSTEMMQQGNRTDVPFGTPGPIVFS